MRRFTTTVLLMTCCLTMTTVSGGEEKKPPASGVNMFGIKPEWVTSPAMLNALNRLQEAGVVEGRRGSLTFFRWSNDKPPKLAHLGLWGPKVTNDVLAHVEKLPDLEFVSLYETNVDDAGLAKLTALPKLRRLAIVPICRYEKAGFGPPQWSYPFAAERAARPRITGDGLRALATTKNLESADLLDARLTAADLAFLQDWPKLSSLGLPNEIDAEVVGRLQACRRLTRLTIGHRGVSAEEIKNLAAWKSLRELKVIHAQLPDAALAAFAELSSLETLILEDCGLTDDRLSQLRTPPSLTGLWLERNEIAGPGLVHLARTPVRSLGLEFNNFDDGALVHLSQLTGVVDLRLSYNLGITDAGLRTGTLQRMTHVKQLNLRGLKQITDASLAELEKFSHLEHIGLRETGVGWEGVARLKKSLPQTNVFK